jgi:hypothetical protein
MEKDPVTARSEYLGLFREELERFLSLENIMACVAPRTRLAAEQGVSYECFVDPSGGKHDSMVAAIGHKVGEKIVVDALEAWRPPFSPGDVVKGISELCRAYRISRVVGDRYGAAWTEAAFQKTGLHYRSCKLIKSDLFLAFQGYLNSGLVEMPDDKKLIRKLQMLERKRGRSGKDTVTHPPRGSDDLANCVAGLNWMLNEKKETGPRIIGYLDPITGDLQPSMNRP